MSTLTVKIKSHLNMQTFSTILKLLRKIRPVTNKVGTQDISNTRNTLSFTVLLHSTNEIKE